VTVRRGHAKTIVVGKQVVRRNVIDGADTEVAVVEPYDLGGERPSLTLV
jgi:hypothetical protein